jgi:hypothetical protein
VQSFAILFKKDLSMLLLLLFNKIKKYKGADIEILAG